MYILMTSLWYKNSPLNPCQVQYLLVFNMCVHEAWYPTKRQRIHNALLFYRIICNEAKLQMHSSKLYKKLPDQILVFVT